MGDLMRYGGPILYLFIYGFVLFAILVGVDSGLILPRRVARPRRQNALSPSGQLSFHEKSPRQDVVAEAQAVSTSDDLLRVLQITKSYDGAKVVDDVSLGVPRDTVFAMLGPNGAGKTTSCSIICGDVVPDMGDVLINGVSVANHPQIARLSLGVCPQFTAIDAQLSVREHLMIYGHLKGLSGPDLNRDVEALMQATLLTPFSDRLASKLSGGNQRKLSLAIALIGEPKFKETGWN
jgi:ATP-binding cassette, subfamily A (ABC1), member 3